MDLGSEGMYLDENCGTNPSIYLLWPKTPVKKKYMIFCSLGGVRGSAAWAQPLN